MSGMHGRKGALPAWTTGLLLWAASAGLAAGTGTRAGASRWPDDIVVNGGAASYDSRPAMDAAPDGSVWVAWHAYHQGRDRIVARQVTAGPPGPLHQVSGEGRIHAGPVVVAGGDAAWVFWSARGPDRWQVLGRPLGAQPGPMVAVSSRQADAIFPAAARIGPDRTLVSWCSYQDGRFGVWARVFEQGSWHEPMPVSGKGPDAFRSAVAVDASGQAWVFWDAYRARHYRVLGRPVVPELGAIEQISPEETNCLTPVALGTRDGLLVAWLQVQDVIAGEGAVSQWHTLQAAIRRDGHWHRITDAAGATLTHGLMARWEPSPVATGGYLGRRRRPMLLQDATAAWLLWERKSDHRGRTPNVTGELAGRAIVADRWQEPVVLHRGLLDYRVAGPVPGSRGGFFLVGSDLPRQARRIYHLQLRSTGDRSPLSQEEWPGWKPLRLPFSEEQTRRPEIRAGGRRYRLYWGDLHCHSGHTADAEGEPDELLHYARDRARLDVCVMTQNDAIYDCYLTEAEFALDRFFASALSQPGRFLVLPGYEWTSRLPRSPTADPADPRNWDAQYWRESFPNHRTIIYPPAGGPVVRHPEVDNDIGRLNHSVQRAGGLTLTQHATWVLTGHPVEVGVEVTSGWGIYVRDPSRLHEALNRGYRVGLVGNGDSHRRNPGLCGGLTGIYAESLTPEAVLEALRSRRVYATNGSRIVVDSRADGALMGQSIRSEDGSVEITLNVTGTRPIQKATLVRDGEPVAVFEGNGTRELAAAHRDTDLAPGTHWYYWRVAQAGTSPDYPGNVKVARGHLAWSSPHWVVVPGGGSP